MGNMLVPPPPQRNEPRGTPAKGEKLAQRLAYIIALLYQGGQIDKRQLAARFGVGVRTIERDLHERLADIAQHTAHGWQLRAHRRHTISASHLEKYARMAGVQDVFPNHTPLPWLIEQLDIPADQRGLHVHSTPEEDIPAPHFARLQAAVQQRRPCRFVYKGKARCAQPYQLIHKNGTWYLAALETDEGGNATADHLKIFSLARISALQVDETATFRHEQQHLDYLTSQSDVWFTAAPTLVRLRAAAPIAHYFQRRELLPQQTAQADPDGSLLITARIHHPQQLLPVVRYWMPHLRIIQPREWEQTLLNELRQTLAAWDGAEQPASKPAQKTARKRAKA